MKQQTRAQLDNYFEQAGSWADERADGLRASRRIAWIVAIIAALVALAEAVALMVLTPLKTVVPYTLLVDRQTGHVQSLDPLRPESVAPDTAITQSFLVQYVLAREGFEIASVQRDFKKVALWSAQAARNDYVNAMQLNNPESPLARLPRLTIIEARVRSVSAIGKNAALIRFETARRDRNASPQPPQMWVAAVTYRYSSEPMTAEDRYVNPLGFQVLSYRKSAETPPQPVEAQTGANAATTSSSQRIGPAEAPSP